MTTNDKNYGDMYNARGAFAGMGGPMENNHTGIVKVDALRSKISATAELVRRAEDALISAAQRERALNDINGAADAELRHKYGMEN